MSSSVHFKFKSWKDPQRITFDGTGITVFELKREIIAVSGLGDGKDFDLPLYNQDNEGASYPPPRPRHACTNSEVEYKDDTEIIPRSSLVICRRIPAARPGYGKAARYVSGVAPTTAKNSYRAEQPGSKPADGKAANGTNALDEMNKAQTEEEKIAAMFKAGGDAWEQTQQQMANAKPVHRPGGFNKKPANVPDHDPPPGYVCYRCQEKGHWIQACPTNDDPNFEKRPRIKRTTGIPRTFLQKVEKPKDVQNDGLTDDRKQGSVMMNADGEYVIVKTDDRTWEKFQEKNKTSVAQKAQANEEQKELEKRGLICPIDGRLFDNPMKTDCCGTTYCNECIENALVNSDLTCPKCGTEGVLIDNLQPDEEMVKKIREFEAEKAAAKRAKERSPSPKSDTSKTEANDKATPNGEQSKEETTKPEVDETNSKEATQSPKSQTATPQSTKATLAEDGTSKKRPAEEELKNDRVPAAPSAPAAMRRQQEMQQKQAMQNIPPGFDKNFIEQMNALAPQNFQNGNMPFMPNMMGMPNMPMNMNMGNMMGMPNGGMMNGMGMGNQNMFGMNGFSNQFGFNGMGGNGFGQQNWNNNNNNNQWGANGMGMQNWQGGNGFPNQQRNGFGNAGFDGQTDDNDAYFRKPVNPHRHANRGRRARPSDYTEL
jgi:protein MPE1